ncbi:hypothetical protein AM1_A0100 (plasmid) [Acaryochloris marina MBIC11017]|uniref:Uncharacterized protein n=1 Tax=Acaryochloris marina (strain MBIC 11017) TaxID=329726 RepID=A8ZKB0_ACAM1|nr:hypothetical protein AM1_A0100 [Acaryochloris marina MBIC11017]
MIGKRVENCCEIFTLSLNISESSKENFTRSSIANSLTVPLQGISQSIIPCL